MSLSALFLNTTLKYGDEKSNTMHLARIFKEHAIPAEGNTLE